MTYNYPELDVIDAQIAKAAAKVTDTGTVTSVISTTRLMVMFNGSTVAVPVKVWTNVPVVAGDRVGLAKFGSDWVVIGGNTAPPPTYGTWIVYNGTFTFRGSTGAAVKGGSTYEAEYMEVNAFLTIVRVRLEFATFTAGTGIVLAGLPYAQSAGAIRRATGQWWMDDSGVAARAGTVTAFDDDEVQFFADGAGAPVTFGTAPVIGNADTIIFGYTFDKA